MRSLLWIALWGMAGSLQAQDWCAPSAIVVTRDSKTMYIGCATGKRVEVFDLTRREVVRRIAMPSPVSGLALSADDAKLYVTCAGVRSTVHIVESGAAVAAMAAGHTAVSPVLSPGGGRLYVCNRYNNDVGVIDVAARK